MVRCTSFYGTSVLVERSRLAFRPAAYALIEDEGRVLLEANRRTGAFFFPGGGVSAGTPMEESLANALMRDAGLPIRVERLFQLRETFTWFDPLDAAYHNLAFFYVATPTVPEFAPDADAGAADPERFAWVDARALTPDHFHAFGHEVFTAWRAARS